MKEFPEFLQVHDGKKWVEVPYDYLQENWSAYEETVNSPHAFTEYFVKPFLREQNPRR